MPPSGHPHPRRRAILWIALSAYPAWLAMMALHETGHVLHARATGGDVERVLVPLLGFSRTDVAPNPRPLVVAWGGPVWGCLLPLVLLAGAGVARRAVRPAQTFAGFCLIANGAYIGLGPWMTAGDGRDLLRHGAPAASLVAFGVVAVSAGLYLGHRASQPAPPPPPPTLPPPPARAPGPPNS
jgi:hypothetical protein